MPAKFPGRTPALAVLFPVLLSFLPACGGPADAQLDACRACTDRQKKAPEIRGFFLPYRLKMFQNDA